MGLKLIVLTLVISAVIAVSESEKKCDQTNEYTRVKRAKYYSNPPLRFYRRPPVPYPVKGAFSFTPPPSYMSDNEDHFSPGGRPQKVSKKAANDGLGDEDINNIVKYLSKQDIDKIIQFSLEKGKYNREVPFESNNPPIRDDRNSVYKGVDTERNKDLPFEYNNNLRDNLQMYRVQESTANKLINSGNNQKPYEIEYVRPQQENLAPRIVNANPNLNNVDSVNTLFDIEESLQNSQIAFFNQNIQEDIKGGPTHDDRNIYTDGKIMQEEILPKPINLREDDYYGSFTNNVPSVVKSDSSSYKVESFGDLPLMNYNSKLDSVSSYHVPHYTVTDSHKKPSPSYSAPPPPDVPFEPAPPISEAKVQSDAHLKATKIWTHRSKGTAYYLHSDGTLSLEKPQKPPRPYGP